MAITAQKKNNQRIPSVGRVRKMSNINPPQPNAIINKAVGKKTFTPLYGLV
jgi:hypothetical protein